MNKELAEERCNELIKKIEEDITNASKIKNEIRKRRIDIPKKEEITISKSNEYEEIETEEIEDEYEEEVSFFLDNYRKIRDDFEDIELYSILPSRKHNEYKRILIRLQLESIKEIKEINDLIIEENLKDKDLEEYNLLIDKEKRKINCLKKLLKEEVIEEDNDINNNIILVPTLSGNIRIIDELEHIPEDYYDGFKELINSIIDGTFKNVKSFKNNIKLQGLSEVKLFKIRIVFTRLSSNTYALITAFIKKSDNDKLYKESLISKVNDYHQIEKQLKVLIEDEEFLEENNKQVENLINLLSKEENIKEYIKDDIND